MTNASRKIKESEVELCASNGVNDIAEIQIGFDGIVLANSKATAQRKLTLRQISLALAKEVPGPNGQLVAKHIERVADHATNIAEQVILVTEARNVKHAAKLATMAPPK
jgi:phosphate transport system substrate-binding protein